MLILFDQGTPVGVRDSLAGHNVKTAHELGWSTLLNGDLLRQAEEADFDVLVTTDKNIVHQQNLKGRRIAVVILGQARWKSIKPVLGVVRESIEKAEAGTFTFVEIAG